MIGMVICLFWWGVEIGEELSRSMSSAWIELHPKQTKNMHTSKQSRGEVSSLMKGCEVSSNNIQEGSPPPVLQMYLFNNVT